MAKARGSGQMFETDLSCQREFTEVAKWTLTPHCAVVTFN